MNPRQIDTTLMEAIMREWMALDEAQKAAMIVKVRKLAGKAA